MDDTNLLTEQQRIPRKGDCTSSIGETTHREISHLGETLHSLPSQCVQSPTTILSPCSGSDVSEPSPQIDLMGKIHELLFEKFDSLNPPSLADVYCEISCWKNHIMVLGDTFKRSKKVYDMYLDVIKVVSQERNVIRKQNSELISKNEQLRSELFSCRERYSASVKFSHDRKQLGDGETMEVTKDLFNVMQAGNQMIKSLTESLETLKSEKEAAEMRIGQLNEQLSRANDVIKSLRCTGEPLQVKNADVQPGKCSMSSVISTLLHGCIDLFENQSFEVSPELRSHMKCIMYENSDETECRRGFDNEVSFNDGSGPAGVESPGFGCTTSEIVLSDDNSLQLPLSLQPWRVDRVSTRRTNDILDLSRKKAKTEFSSNDSDLMMATKVKANGGDRTVLIRQQTPPNKYIERHQDHQIYTIGTPSYVKPEDMESNSSLKDFIVPIEKKNLIVIRSSDEGDDFESETVYKSDFSNVQCYRTSSTEKIPHNTRSGANEGVHKYDMRRILVQDCPGEGNWGCRCCVISFPTKEFLIRHICDSHGLHYLDDNDKCYGCSKDPNNTKLGEWTTGPYGGEELKAALSQWYASFMGIWKVSSMDKGNSVKAAKKMKRKK